ncbi:MAG: glycosyltransferase family 39 protein [Chloroflexota bacterium]
MRRFWRLTAVSLLLLFWWRLLDTAVTLSATFDEPLHLLQAVLYWRQWPLLSVVQNPPLVNAMIGLPLRLAFHPALPPEMTGAVFQDWLTLAKQFLWQANGNGLQILFVGRLAVIWLALLLGALLARWGGRWFGAGGGLLTLLLYTMDPNVLAHGALATTDMGTAVFVTLAAYAAWRYWTRLDQGQEALRWHYALAGVALGLALASKFSGIILLPALLLIVLWRVLTRQERRRGLRPWLDVVGWVLLGTAVFLLLYRFNWAALHMDFSLQQAHQSEGHSSFLLGQVNVGGWWYYFPLLFVMKTPLALLLLLPGVIVLWVRRWPWSWAQGWLWLLLGGFAAASLLSRVNIGYRYLLPILPLLFVLAGELSLAQRWRRWALLACLAWLVLESAWYHPGYLAYFNQVAGGPDGGWQVAVDSNLDWGQDVGRLAQAQVENGWPQLQASWLGTAPAAVYGLQAEMLPGWPWRKPQLQWDDFYPERPTPGWYVLSATQLQGVYLDDPAQFAWFRQQQVTARVGYSLFVYEVPPLGAETAVALSGVGIGAVALRDYDAIVVGNHARLLWYDARSSFVWPGGEQAWLVVGEGHTPTQPALQALYPSQWQEGEREVDGTRWQYRYYALQPPLAAAEVETAVFGDTLRLLDVSLAETAVAPPLTLLTYWQVITPPPGDLKIFVHMLDATGALVAQHDGLDVQMRHLQAGDVLVQLHTLSAPDDWASGGYSLRVGLYDPATGARLLTATGTDSVTVDSWRSHP